MADTVSELAIEETILSLTAARGAGRSICPSEAARQIGGVHPDGWGRLMPVVRRIAVRLAIEGRIVILRKGKPVDPRDFRGVYRLATPIQETQDRSDQRASF